MRQGPGGPEEGACLGAPEGIHAQDGLQGAEGQEVEDDDRVLEQAAQVPHHGRCMRLACPCLCLGLACTHQTLVAHQKNVVTVKK